MKNLNNRLLALGLSNYPFITCCYCLLNIETMEVTYVRAGHPYPILLRNGGQPKHMEIPGPLLGIFEEPEYPQKTIKLQNGDKLLLYSDEVESVINDLDKMDNLNFKEEFHKIKDLPIVEIINNLNVLSKSTKIASSGVDDITIVGLEVL